jgi:hypothetical protein
MVQSSCRLRLPPETGHEVGVLGVLGRQDLHRDGPPEDRVGRLEDAGHAAAAELSLDPIPAREDALRPVTHHIAHESAASNTARAIGAAT